MPISDQYELLDFGAGRKLERFGPWVVDRPSPAAQDHAPKRPEMWSKAAARYERSEGQRGSWTHAAEIVPEWQVSCGPFALELKLTEYGQVGLFPEQANNWNWIAEQVRAAAAPIKVLNLFAYTGGSTLAAAVAGAEVTHVDAAAGVVTWARRNARVSNLSEVPIRWITEDARKFVRRELKRGNFYDAVILDPPSYGHGPGGEAWKLEEHLGELLTMCDELTAGRRQFFLLTCHSGDLAFSPALLKHTIAYLPELREAGRLSGADMRLRSASGDLLHCGAAIRFSRNEVAAPPRARPLSKPAGQ
jgi:23S rRNA (cytosine1962-C5)-methyltransferase